jgi:DNA-binding GntR family transcriptional regulator
MMNPDDDDPAFRLERAAPAPLYQQLVDAFRQEITSQRWPNNYKLPREDVLAEQFKVSRGTLKRALAVLVGDGLLTQIHGKGTFVTSAGTDVQLVQRLVSLQELLLEAKRPFRTELLEQGVRPGPDNVRAILHAAEDEDLLFLRRRLIVGDEPAVILHNYVRLSLAPHIAQEDFKHRTLFRAIETGGKKITWGQRAFSAVSAGELAGLLGCKPDHPLLYLNQVSFLADDQPIEYSDVWARGDQLQISTILRR